jgi:hypothetical protein
MPIRYAFFVSLPFFFDSDKAVLWRHRVESAARRHFSHATIADCREDFVMAQGAALGHVGVGVRAVGWDEKCSGA